MMRFNKAALTTAKEDKRTFHTPRIFRAAAGGRLYCTFYTREAASGKLPEQTCWCVTVGVAFDYVAVQSKAVMSLSHLDPISSGRNTCSRVCRIQSRHGNLDFIKERREWERGKELAVWSKCTTVFLVCSCSFFSLSLCVLMHIILCILLQYACECVKYENLMKPTSSVWLQNVTFLILPGAALMKPAHFWVSVVKFRHTPQKSIDLSARMPSELIINELSELEAGKGI